MYSGATRLGAHIFYSCYILFSDCSLDHYAVSLFMSSNSFVLKPNNLLSRIIKQNREKSQIKKKKKKLKLKWRNYSKQHRNTNDHKRLL